MTRGKEGQEAEGQTYSLKHLQTLCHVLSIAWDIDRVSC